MSTYLGVSVRLWLLWALAAVALSAAVVSSGLFPSPADCGYVLEEGVWLEASCVSEEELEGRLERIRASRSGQREWDSE